MSVQSMGAGLLIALASLLPAEAEPLAVRPDKENVVAGRLEGTWEPDATLNDRLGGRAAGTIAFQSDPAVAGKVPAKYEGFLKNKTIYMAGKMTFGAKEYQFLLIEHRGNPHVVLFAERGGDPFGNAESLNVMLGVAKESANDVLLLGGDFNNQSFAAYRRAKE